jgi:Tol biopolymer transport system component
MFNLHRGHNSRSLGLFVASVSLLVVASLKGFSGGKAEPPQEIVYVAEASTIVDVTQGVVKGVFKRRLGKGKPIQLANRATSPEVSPDGSRVAFLGTAQNPNPELFVMDVDGKHAVRIAPSIKGTTVVSASWAPDSKKIVFSQSGKENSGIYIVNSDGSGLAKLDDSKAADLAWSPDGKLVAFCAVRDGTGVSESSRIGIPTAYGDHIWIEPIGNVEREVNIYTIDVETKKKSSLTMNANKNLHPSWAPDGRTIAFASNREGRYNVYTMNSDGSMVEKFVGGSSWHTWFPSWSPDGKALVFQITKSSDERQRNSIISGTDQIVIITTNGERTVVGRGSQPRFVPAQTN